MRKTDIRTIDGSVYVVKQCGAKEGRAIFFRLSKLLGAPLSGLVAKIDLAQIDGAANTFEMVSSLQGGLAAALTSWVSEARQEDFEYLCEAFASHTKLRLTLDSSKGGEIETDLIKQFDDHFAGNYGAMILWLAFAIEVNFQSFLPLIRREVKDALGKLESIRMQSVSKSQPE